jgi:hypothetical protein
LGDQLLDSLKPTKTVYTVNQFLDWQKSGTLNLHPIFQRRPVWKSPAKSQLIDSVVRGYPIPIILLRQVQDIDTLSMTMEVVDGQQRLRTLLAFVDPSCLVDFSEERDSFFVSRSHNPGIAGKPFHKLEEAYRREILSYEFSTHVFPASTGDELIFRIFARLNSTGLSLNKQELRNSEFHGALKALVYDLSFQYLDSWRRWKIFSNDAMSRMEEAEAVSDYLLAMFYGIQERSQNKINKFYADHEEDLPEENAIRQRFAEVMTAIDACFGSVIASSAFRRPALFYSLFTAIYDHMFGLESEFRKIKPKPLPSGLKDALVASSNLIRTKDLSESVQDAMDKATSDKRRREIRYKFLMESLGLERAQ